MIKDMPYDRFYPKLMDFSVWIYTNILRFGKYENESVVKFAAANKNSNVLDYGCNTGRHALFVKQAYGYNVMGADINPAAIAACKRKGIKAEVITENFFEKYSSFFDIIINSHVLEHVDDPKDFLVNIKGMLKDEGTFVIVIPQERIRGDITIPQILYFFLRLKFENPHKHKFSKNQLFSLLDKTGFTPQDYVFCNFLPPFLTKHLIYLKSRSLVIKCTKK
ncbi:MAG: class I SAM-dependent methyltransferase [Candidatus Marinimicrobia bacterium]|nr:class I SAM-dependent methyltransferase [Candidatus Neomarinimicrobiota bacterium]